MQAFFTSRSSKVTWREISLYFTSSDLLWKHVTFAFIPRLGTVIFLWEWSCMAADWVSCVSCLYACVSARNYRVLIWSVISHYSGITWMSYSLKRREINSYSQGILSSGRPIKCLVSLISRVDKKIRPITSSVSSFFTYEPHHGDSHSRPTGSVSLF